MFYTAQQFHVFSEDLPRAFLDLGFEVVEEPNIDYALGGFRATYIRRYDFDKSANFYDEALTSLVQCVGLPFGHQGQKMIVISTPKSIKNEQIAEATKLRLQFDAANQCHVLNSEYHSQKPETLDRSKDDLNYLFVGQAKTTMRQVDQFNNEEYRKRQLAQDLAGYIKHLIQIISPGLIQLPTEIKLEILKKLSVHSVVKMSQVNNEFRSIIYRHGESLWKHFCMRDFNIRSINRKIHRSWMNLYRDSFFIHQIETCRKERALPGLPERPALPPVPYRLQIEWLPEVLELPFQPLDNQDDARQNDQLHLALEMIPLHRAESLDSLV